MSNDRPQDGEDQNFVNYWYYKINYLKINFLDILQQISSLYLSLIFFLNTTTSPIKLGITWFVDRCIKKEELHVDYTYFT